MKRNLILLVLMAAAFVVAPVFASNAQASQGFYGYVYAFVDNVNDCSVEYAVVKVYDGDDKEVDSTIASTCGYYSVSVESRGWYTIVVEYQTYNARGRWNCSTIVTTENFGARVGVFAVTGFWINKDIIAS